MLEGLNEKQKEAVTCGDGPVLVVAGAGSGKTKTLTTRLAYLIADRGISPDAICAITFTNKAAREMKDRVGVLLQKYNLGNETKEPFVGTFHAFGARMLRSHASKVGRTSAFSIYDADDTQRLIKKITKDLVLDNTLTHAALRHEFSRIKSENISQEAFCNDSRSQSVWNIFQLYEEGLTDRNAFDFDDLIQKPAHILHTHPEIAEKYAKKFSHILVDEYQDINTAQYNLIELLARSHRNIMVVGDDAQAIYRFRFSDFRNFLNFERQWKDVKVILLEQNYRSTQNIIESSSALIAKNVVQKKKNLWTGNEEGAPITIIEQDDEFSQADYIVSHARAYAKKGLRVAVLYRTNAQSRALEQIFLEYNIPYELFGALSFYERKEIKDIIAAVKYVYNPKDDMSALRLEKDFGKRLWAKVKEELDAIPKELPPVEYIECFLKAAGYMERVRHEHANYAERIENIQELMVFARQFSSTEEFVEKISLADAFEKDSNRAEREAQGEKTICLMTIHLAKGLEFDVVFIAGANEGLIPHQRSLFSLDDVEEERRLMYVAMTRARQELIICFYDVASRFLYELPPAKVRFEGVRGFGSGDDYEDDEERYISYD